MIRVEFDTIPHDAWSRELLTNHVWVTAMRIAGIPVKGRLAFSGLEYGTLSFAVKSDGKTHFTFRDAGEASPTGNFTFDRTHVGKGYTVFMSGQHLAKHQEDDEL